MTVKTYENLLNTWTNLKSKLYYVSSKTAISKSSI